MLEVAHAEPRRSFNNFAQMATVELLLKYYGMITYGVLSKMHRDVAGNLAVLIIKCKVCGKNMVTKVCIVYYTQIKTLSTGLESLHKVY